MKVKNLFEDNETRQKRNKEIDKRLFTIGQEIDKLFSIPENKCSTDHNEKIKKLDAERNKLRDKRNIHESLGNEG
jgi:hypothetical protein